MPAQDQTAALVLALSAQVDNFEKNMNKALDIANKRTKDIETVFQKMNDKINESFKDLAKEFPGGQFLASLGPDALIAAAGIGALVLAFKYLSDETEKYVQKNIRFKEVGDTIGVTAAQVKQLTDAGQKVGLSIEATEQFLERFGTAVQGVKVGSGALYQQLIKIDPALVEQMATANDTSAALLVLVEAYKKASTASAQLALTRAAGGGRSPEAARLLKEIADNGLKPIQKGLNDVSAAMEEQEIRIKDLRERLHDLTGAIAAPELKNAEEWRLQTWIKIAQAINSVVEAARGYQAWAEAHPVLSGIAGVAATAATGGAIGIAYSLAKAATGIGQTAGPSTAPATFADRYPAKDKQMVQTTQAALDAKKATDDLAKSEQDRKDALQRDLVKEQKDNAVLGDAATQSEALALKKKQLAVAVELEGASAEKARRGEEDLIKVQEIAKLATLERLGIASQSEITQERMIQLTRDAAKYELDRNQVLAATNVLLKESKTAAEALAVRRSYFPGLTQLALDAKNLQKGLDEVATRGINSFVDELSNVALGTKTAAQAFKDMTTSILSDIAKLAIRQAIVGPLLGSLGLGLTASSATPLGMGGIGHAQSGTTFAHGGMTLVGERGPELLNIPRGSQIIPNDVLKAGGFGGGGQIVYSPSIDARGASVEAVQRLAQILEQDRQTFATRTVSTIRAARKSRIPGV